jgi:CBS domain containing-hemolysin-like protein
MLAITAPGASEGLELFGILVCLVFVGVFAASEIAITRMSVVRAMALVDEGRRGAKRLATMLQDPARYLNTILLLTLIGTEAAAILAAGVAEKIFGNLGVTIATVVVTVLLFVFSETIPKTYALQHTERAAFLFLPVVRAITPLFSPISRVMIGISNVIVPGKGLREGPFVSEAEIRQFVEIAGEEESIEAEERQMIHSVFEFNDTVVREVMVPRPDMVTIDITTPLNGVLELVVDHGYSRIPTWRGDVDHIEGLVYAKDILARIHRNGDETTAEEIVRPANFVPETKRISELLREMRLQKYHMAVVFDEYGAVTGLVTLEDLIEEIVGEIVDEYDVEEPKVEVIDESTVRANARLPIDEANELLDVELPEGEWDSVGGLVIGQLGRVPVEGEAIECNGVVVTAEKVEGHRVVMVRIEKLPEEPEAAHAEPA